MLLLEYLCNSHSLAFECPVTWIVALSGCNVKKNGFLASCKAKYTDVRLFIDTRVASGLVFYLIGGDQRQRLAAVHTVFVSPRGRCHFALFCPFTYLVWPLSVARLLLFGSPWRWMFFNDESYSVSGQFVYQPGIHTEGVHTSTHVPVWAGFFDVFMTRACSLRNCSISDLQGGWGTSGREEKRERKKMWMKTWDKIIGLTRVWGNTRARNNIFWVEEMSAVRLQRKEQLNMEKKRK